MSKLGQVVESVERYNQFVLDQAAWARLAAIVPGSGWPNHHHAAATPASTMAPATAA